MKTDFLILLEAFKDVCFNFHTIEKEEKEELVYLDENLAQKVTPSLMLMKQQPLMLEQFS